MAMTPTGDEKMSCNEYNKTIDALRALKGIELNADRYMWIRRLLEKSTSNATFERTSKIIIAGGIPQASDIKEFK